MTSFFAIQFYSPLLILGVGISTFVGLWGLGAALLSLVRLEFPSPWDQVAALLLGIQTLSLAVQITGILQIASRSVLVTIWFCLVAIGAVMLVHRASQIGIPRLPHRLRPHLRYWPAALPLAIVATAVTTNTLVALAPSTKADDLYYHMLVPSRILSDSKLQFYQEPWEAAIWPHMVFQVSATPTHALGYPDSVNVVSWALSATLLWFAWRIIRANANTVPWSALCIGTLSVGLYPIVWHVSYSAHAMGDLALAAAIVAFCNRERLLASLPPWGHAALLSILLLSASSSKISLLPLSVFLLSLGVWPLFKSALPVARPRIALAILVPWIIFYGPIASWTWIHSGSPFGPVLASLLTPSIHSQTWAQEIQATRIENQQLLTMIRNSLFGYSPLIWVGAIGALFTFNLSIRTRFTLGCLLALQCILIYWMLPYDLRFLSIHYGLFIVFASLKPGAIQERLNSGQWMAAVCVLFLLPWLVAQIYYAQQFFPVSLGLEKTAFYERNIPLYSDYVKLNKILSNDTVLLCLDLRLSAVYAPRPIFFNPADLPQAKSVALITAGQSAQADGQSFEFGPGHVVYQNDRAILRTYRTPGRTPIVGPLKVVTLSRNLPQTPLSQ